MSTTVDWSSNDSDSLVSELLMKDWFPTDYLRGSLFDCFLCLLVHLSLSLSLVIPIVVSFCSLYSFPFSSSLCYNSFVLWFSLVFFLVNFRQTQTHILEKLPEQPERAQASSDSSEKLRTPKRLRAQSELRRRWRILPTNTFFFCSPSAFVLLPYSILFYMRFSKEPHCFPFVRKSKDWLTGCVESTWTKFELYWQ